MHRPIPLMLSAVFCAVLSTSVLAAGQTQVCFKTKTDAVTSPTRQGNDKKTGKGQDVCIDAEIAETTEELIKGLQFREKLAENQGMLFIFDAPRIAGFWMKNMKIPLDMIWVSKAKKIVSMHQNVPPCVEENCVSYAPSTKVLYVIEVPAGMVEKWGLKEGDRVSIDYRQ